MRFASLALPLLFLSLRHLPSASSRGFEQTSLERIFSRAFAAKVEDGTWAETFGGAGDIEASSFCTGNPSAWPVPQVVPGSDLENVMSRGTFICGYPRDLYYAADNGEALIDTRTDPPTGKVVEWFNILAEEASSVLGATFDVTWLISKESQDTLDQLNTGVIDAACGRWFPDGIWTSPEGQKVSRALGFSVMHCASYLQTAYVFMRAGSDVDSFDSLVQAMDGGSVTGKICTAGSPGGGSEQTCTNTFQQHTTSGASCEGKTNFAFALLKTGECGLVWGGSPNPEEVTAFKQPIMYSPVTLFRYDDVDRSGTLEFQPDAEPPSTANGDEDDLDEPKGEDEPMDEDEQDQTEPQDEQDQTGPEDEQDQTELEDDEASGSAAEQQQETQQSAGGNRKLAAITSLLVPSLRLFGFV